MSYCKLITFKDGKPSGGTEYRNAWGGAARIWDSLFQKYLQNPTIKYHNWMNCGNELWDLYKNPSLQMFERAVHLSQFDLAYVSRKHFKLFSDDIKAFVAEYPVPAQVDHLTAWADEIEKLDCGYDAIGFYATSVGDNLWFDYDEKTDKTIPVPLSNGFEVYQCLSDLETSKAV